MLFIQIFSGKDLGRSLTWGSVVNKYFNRSVFFIAFAALGVGLWFASQWWEKHLAQRLGVPAISPDFCYRLETFKPFWVLPNVLHRRPDPNEDQPPEWFPWWEYPGFLRLYDDRTGALITETKIYDLEMVGGQMSWSTGSGTITAGMILLGQRSPDCPNNQPLPSQLP